jgi:hypothetical protein
MDAEPEATDRRFPWAKVVAIALLVVAVFYASQHPHSLFAHIVKFIIIPIP